MLQLTFTFHQSSSVYMRSRGGLMHAPETSVFSFRNRTSYLRRETFKPSLEQDIERPNWPVTCEVYLPRHTVKTVAPTNVLVESCRPMLCCLTSMYYMYYMGCFELVPLLRKTFSKVPTIETVDATEKCGANKYQFNGVFAVFFYFCFLRRIG